ncbi:GTPase activating protein [Niveomyces insectorum RCEF 264]|uniref:GTPase-activating protein GYP5 n=1 Tax=Niveomyces insectorum RCEF 264 TaxID=1081102 RepID=A0A162IE89_9HYPO|nr:GTPase activating protein [Niveomyces insectorum RCEF 264]
MSDLKDEATLPGETLEHDVSPDGSDRETDTFEDAPDTASIRSLTKRTPSTSTGRPAKAASPPTDASKSELEKAFQRVRGRSVPIASEEKDEEEVENQTKQANSDEANKEDERAVAAAPPAADINADTNGDHDHHDHHDQHHQHQNSLPIPDASIEANGADLDNISLDDDAGPKDAARESSPPVPERDFVSKTLSLSSFTNALPSIPWSPSHTSESPAGTKPLPISPAGGPLGAPPAAPTRKLTGPFAWLSRGSVQKEAPAISPPLSQGSSSVVSPRRNTASSVATLTSNPEMMLSKLEEEGDPRRGPGRGSLKDRFKMIRMREEAGVAAAALTSDDERAVAAPTESPSPPKTSTGLGVPAGAPGDEHVPTSPMPASPNPSLAPGTVSGATAGPSTMADAAVDWDLWQAVIYEGPAAVARTSPEELNRAIATGIPSAIRGVVWQVLAQSKNEELEFVYHDLAARGTEREKERQSSSNGSTGKEPPSSTTSSIHSGDSSSAPSASSNHINGNNGNSGNSGNNGSTNGFMAAATAAVAAAAASASAARSSSTPSISSAEKESKKKEKIDAAMLQKLEKTIRRDLGARTSYSKFATAQGLQESLFGVCKAYALFDEAVGYAQGMNFLIMPILFNMPEEEAFCLLVRLMNQYRLRDLFVQDMPGLHMHLYLFERLLEDLEPALYCHLHRRGISPHLYATQWFLTLFAYRFPLQLVLRIYDLILSEGLAAILKFGLVLMQKNATALLGMSDMSQLTTYLKDRLFDVYIDASPSAGSILENGFFGSSSSSLDKEVYRADQFVRDACEIKLLPELIKAYTAEWEEKTRLEKERELELETLRSTNASLAVKVRKFEERIEAVDREQAALATELVHTKVQNEELRDENESLKGQVRELKVVIEQQPEQLEQAWQAERDDLMQRNAKVHEENQKVEKEMAELEEELVQTKMQYAEVNSQHEALTRKWSELKRQFL